MNTPQIHRGLEHWVSPEGEHISVNCEPDFYDPIRGLGWLFQYVVLKVCKTGKGYEVTLQIYWDGGELFCEVIIKDIDTGAEFDSITKEPQVALANTVVKWLESNG